jgi:hypothetical protein
MPFGMSHTNRYDDVASRYGWLISYGLAPWSLLSRLQLAALCRSFPARHDYRSNGSHHSRYIGRENAAVAQIRFLHDGCLACALWGTVNRLIPNCTNVRLWPLADIPVCAANVRFREQADMTVCGKVEHLG